MAATASMLSLPGRDSGIEGIPSEILDKIFFFVCDDDCDVSLSLSSMSMLSKLHDHPIVRTLRALVSTQEMQVIFQGMCQSDNSVMVRLMCPQSVVVAQGQASDYHKVATTHWYTAAFVVRLQIALIKRVLRTYWDPLLARDGYSPSDISQAYMYAELTEFATNPAALRDEWLIESRVDAVRGRYPWTRTYVWPKQGRILIRDQLLNGSCQYCVPVLDKFLEGQKRPI